MNGHKIRESNTRERERLIKQKNVLLKLSIGTAVTPAIGTAFCGCQWLRRALQVDNSTYLKGRFINVATMSFLFSFLFLPLFGHFLYNIYISG